MTKRRQKPEPPPRLGSDPYAALGLPRGAAPDAVKAAYRRLAAQYHPDRNPGDPDAEARYKSVVQAYEAITGRTTPDNAHAAAAGILSECLGTVVAGILKQGQRPVYTDVVREMKQTLTNTVQKHEKDLQDLKTQAGALEEMRGRFEGDDTLMEDLLENHLLVLQDAMQKLAQTIATLKKAREVAGSYRFRADVRQTLTATASTSAGTNRWIWSTV